MSGVSTLRFGDDAGTGGGSGGSLGSLAWNNIYGPPGTRFATTNTLTVSGITGSLTLQMSLSAGGVTGYIKNGGALVSATTHGVPIQVSVKAGDTLAWAINNDSFSGDISGTATIERMDTMATVDTFTYFVQF